MSPAGIPLFYGALDRETPIAEVGPAKAVTIGRFVNSVALVVIDLAALPEIPSIFDEAQRHLRERTRFLQEFVKRVAEPVRRERSEREAVEYVPTQIVSEYFRTVFEREHGRRIDGLLYRSTQREDGVCCALFVPRERCVDAPGAPSVAEPRLVLADVQRREGPAAA